MYLELWILVCFILALIFLHDETADALLLFRQNLQMGTLTVLKSFLP